MRFDYVIVGAGAAGCVLASRLSQDPSTSVLLIERGGPARNPLFYVPKAFVVTMQRPRYADHYPTEPVVSGSPGESWIRGKVLGGSTAINGMMYARGERDDYDRLADAGNPGWDWDTILRVYRSMEDHELGASPLRGAGGPLPVSMPRSEILVTGAMVAAGEALGIRHVPDVNADEGERIGTTPSTIRAGLRVSAAGAFLHPIRRRPNLTVVDRTSVGSLLFDGTRAVGVRARRRGSVVDVRARREVLLAAGAVESPLLLERSGIGNGDVLARAGIDLRVESPNVGERVVEQRGLPVKARLREGLGLNPRLRSPTRRLRTGIGYLLTRRGPLATGPYELLAFLRSAPGTDRPDIVSLFTPLSTDASGLAVEERAGLMVQSYPLRPTTRSAVHVSGASPDSPPLIQPRFLETPEDRRVTARTLERVRELLATPPLADLVVDEEAPGPSTATEEDTVGYALAAGTGIYHAVGSCAMGPADHDVVDGRLRVRGTSGLRVVDASVFPEMPAGGSAAPTMAAAWRAADFVQVERA